MMKNQVVASFALRGAKSERVSFHEEDALLLRGLEAFERGFVSLVHICNIGIDR